tara:strand:+ start:553 stop:903 length:351 start_codon:yes stop_codon:yes gene_type:complete
VSDRDNDLDPPFCRRSVLVRPDGSAVDHLDVTSHEAIVACDAGIVALWQASSRCPLIAAPRRYRSARAGHQRVGRRGVCWATAARLHAIRNRSHHIGACQRSITFPSGAKEPVVLL